MIMKKVITFLILSLTLAIADQINVSSAGSDTNGDGSVDGTDLATVLGFWGGNDPVADINGDDLVDGTDLSLILGAWGLCP